MRGQTRWSPVLVQRAVSEDPRWTRAVGDHTSPPSRKTMKESGLSLRAVKDSPATSLSEKGDDGVEKETEGPL